MNHTELALSSMKEGFSCSQAVLSVYAEMNGLDRELALKIASGFGGGMGSMGETCGAVTGAFMVIGLKHGSAEGKDKQSKKKTYGLVREFIEHFESKHGSVVCKDLLGIDLSTADGPKLARKKKVFFSHCPKFVHDAVKILDEIL